MLTIKGNLDDIIKTDIISLISIGEGIEIMVGFLSEMNPENNLSLRWIIMVYIALYSWFFLQVWDPSVTDRPTPRLNSLFIIIYI